MTAVEFHTGLGDPLGFACRLLRKALRAGARVAVTAPAAEIAALDRELWVFDERDFVPHVRWTGTLDARVLARTPLWLVDGALPRGAPPVVVNIDGPAPGPAAGIARLIELVGESADAQARARERWREYKARGLTVVHHLSGERRER